MRFNTIAWVVFGFAYTALVIALTLTYPALPERVASHFDVAGLPNGWMPRRSYILFLGAVGLALPWLLIAATRMIRRLPVSMVNLPNKQYWMAAEHRDEVYRATELLGTSLAAGEVLLFLQLHLSTVRANLADPVRLQMPAIWTSLAAFLLAIVIGLAAFYLHFQRVPGKGRS